MAVPQQEQKRGLFQQAMDYTKEPSPKKGIFAVREVVHRDIPTIYRTRGMACAVEVEGRLRLLTWQGVINEHDQAKPIIELHRCSKKFSPNQTKYRLEKSQVKQTGSFSFISVIQSGAPTPKKDYKIFEWKVPGDDEKWKDVLALSFIGCKDVVKFGFTYDKGKHELNSPEKKECFFEKSSILGSPIITDDLHVIGVVGEDSDGRLCPYFLTETEVGNQETEPSEVAPVNDPDIPDAPAPAPPSHQPISGTSQEERKELREERHRLLSEHEENDPSEGGTGNVPYAPGGPGETTKDLENVKHVIRESKCESKGVPTRDITDGLIEAVSDMGLIVSDNDGKGNCLFHALSEQLETVKKIKIPHDELRKTLVQYLKENPEKKDGADLYSMLDENQRTRFGGWDEYLTDMAKDGIWGDEMILFAAANHFKTVIYVISSSPGKERQKIPVRPECKVEDKNPIWLGHIYDCHFVSLLKAPVPPSHQPFNGTSQEECKELEEERHKLVSGRHKQAASSTDSVVQSSQSSKEILRSGQFCSKDLPYLALDIQATKKWKVIRTDLDVSDGELSGIDDDYERCYMMIKIWLNKNGKRASYEKLAEVLKRVGLSAIRTNYCLEGNHPPSQEIEDIHTFENVKQQEIRESDLMKIGNEITNQRWRLGRVLGVKDGELEQIKENHREDSLEQSFRILKRWMEIKGSHATYTALAKALLDRTVALQSVLEKFCLEK